MQVQEKSRREYQARINRATDYIDRHLDEPLGLKEIAEIAHFSPYHFHRIFIFMVGETPMGYIQRLRLQKATWKIQKEPWVPIAEVAACCGFGSASFFSRCFKKQFGVSPTVYGKIEKPVFVPNGRLFNKEGQGLRKYLTDRSDLDSDLCPRELKQMCFMESNVEIKEMPEMKVIYCRHTGPFNQIGDAYAKLAR